jgi:CDP-diglyceride synthetase
MTTAADFATQTTFPVGEATSSGFLLFGGQITGVIIVIILSFIFTEQSLFGTRLLIIFLIAAPIIGLIFVSLLKEILKR